MVTVGKDSTPLELLEKQYVAELVKVDAAEDLSPASGTWNFLPQMGSDCTQARFGVSKQQRMTIGRVSTVDEAFAIEERMDSG